MRTQKAAALVLCLVVAGCGHYPAPLHSARDIRHTSSSETMVVIVGLPLEDWPRLERFDALEHFRIAKETAYQVGDPHVKVLSALKLPKLRQVSLAHCTNLTDAGVQALTRLPSIEGFQLVDAGITDKGLAVLTTGFPRLTVINVEGCSRLTTAGFMSLSNSPTITDVSLSLAPFSQREIEGIISAATNVTWWTISDPKHRLDQESLRRLGESRQIAIQVADENNYVTGITRSRRNTSTQPTR